MTEPTRRGAFALTGAAGLVGALGPAPTNGAADERAVDEQLKKDRTFVLAAGMTEAEADCWELAARTAGKYFALPELHPMDRQEIASAIHVIQNKLLSRPTYRRYLELAKKGTAKNADQK
jgi:hypothetical protein